MATLIAREHRSSCPACVGVACVGVLAFAAIAVPAYLTTTFWIVRYLVAVGPELPLAGIVGSIIAATQIVVLLAAYHSSADWTPRVRLLSLSIIALAFAVINVVALYVTLLMAFAVHG